jgi:hypothetical protein
VIGTRPGIRITGRVEFAMRHSTQGQKGDASRPSRPERTPGTHSSQRAEPMRFMIIRKADVDSEAGLMPSHELLNAMTQYNQRMADAGIIVGGEGLHPSSRGARISFSGGKPTVTQGPFAGAGEMIAGFTLIEVKSRDEALEWVRQWPVEDANGNAQLELRQVFTADDFGEAFTPELRAQEDAMRDEIAVRAH